MRGPVGPGTDTPAVPDPDTAKWPAVVLLLLLEALVPAPAATLLLPALAPPLLLLLLPPLLLLLLVWMTPGKLEAGAADLNIED